MKELSRIFGLPESKTGIQPIKKNYSKDKKKKNSVQEDIHHVNCLKSDLDLHYRDLTLNELSMIDNGIKENVGKKIIEHFIFLNNILNCV